jgi:putative peptide zinc metalloprotease protein
MMQPLIKLNDECKFYPYDSGRSEKEEFIIHTPTGRQFRISRLAKDILQQMDGQTSLEEIARALNRRSIAISDRQLFELVEKRYRALGVFANYAPEDEELNSRQVAEKQSAFLLYWEIIPRKYVVWLSRRLVFFHHYLAALSGVIAIVVSHYLVYGKYTSHEFLSNGSFIWVLGLCLFSILAHEFGHAAAVSKYGGTPGSIGFALYILMPSFYADVSEIWRFSRRQRMVVDLGGVYFQQLVFAGFTFIGVFTSAPEYFLACRLIDLMALLTLNPIFQFDGYWLLVDYLGLPKLYKLALNYLKYSVKNVFSSKKEIIVLPPMRKHVHFVFLIYTLLCNFFLIAVVWMSIHYLERVFTRLPAAFSAMFYSMIFALKTQDFALFINRLLSLFFVCALPTTAVVGLFRYANRLLHPLVTKIKLPRRVEVAKP